MGSIFATTRKIHSSVYQIVLLALFLMYTTLLLSNSLFVTDKFDNDAATIRLLILGQFDIERTIFDGFRNTALIFRMVGAEYLFPEWLVVLIANIIYWSASILVLKRSSLHRQNLFTITICLGWIFCSALFLSRYSKELIALIPVFFICFVRIDKPILKVAAALIVLAFVIFIRPYWAICLGLFFASYYLFFRLKLPKLIKIALFSLVYFFPFVLSSQLRGDYLTDWRVVANLDFYDPYRAQSAIDNLMINTSAFTDYSNALCSWLYLNLPFKLLLSGELRYKIFALFQFGSIFVLATAIYSEVRIHNMKRAKEDPYYSRCISFLLAYSLTQAIFEPDVGSFLRHQIILAMPLIYILYPRYSSLQPRSLLRVN